MKAEKGIERERQDLPQDTDDKISEQSITKIEGLIGGAEHHANGAKVAKARYQGMLGQ